MVTESTIVCPFGFLYPTLKFSGVEELNVIIKSVGSLINSIICFILSSYLESMLKNGSNLSPKILFAFSKFSRF